MANSAQAKKRVRQDEVRRVRNKSVKSELNTLEKRFLGLIEEKEKDAAGAVYLTLVSKLDRAAHRRVMHPNTAANRKSRLTRTLASL